MPRPRPGGWLALCLTYSHVLLDETDFASLEVEPAEAVVHQALRVHPAACPLAHRAASSVARWLVSCTPTPARGNGNGRTLNARRVLVACPWPIPHLSRPVIKPLDLKLVRPLVGDAFESHLVGHAALLLRHTPFLQQQFELSKPKLVLAILSREVARGLVGSDTTLETATALHAELDASIGAVVFNGGVGASNAARATSSAGVSAAGSGCGGTASAGNAEYSQRVPSTPTSATSFSSSDAQMVVGESGRMRSLRVSAVGSMSMPTLVGALISLEMASSSPGARLVCFASACAFSRRPYEPRPSRAAS
eukprot:CAMPEP_0115888388 /NCGR_PEP_ID=MMETSP0287-20121206/32282_1 /TAXON_ID=412157 /ORGANISM="Chrysochromulina rotalis, Strain UIO044" /LENGTH=307 /DNA_ID=CAMNT_0003345071 /DNA_START=25 /DNA_END=950 /DNA_ORIENTATION=+